MESSLGCDTSQQQQNVQQTQQHRLGPNISAVGGGGSQSTSAYGSGGYGGMMMDFGTMMSSSSSNNNNNNAQRGGGGGDDGGSASSSNNGNDSDGSGFDLNMSTLNDDSTLLAEESLDALLSSYAGDEEQQQPKAVQFSQLPPLQQSHQHPIQQQQLQMLSLLQQMQQLQQQQQQQQASTFTMAAPSSSSALVNNLFSFHPQLGLVAAGTCTGGMPTLPFFTVAPVVSATNIASLLGGGTTPAASGTTTLSSSMAAPPPLPPASARVAKAVATSAKSPSAAAAAAAVMNSTVAANNPKTIATTATTTTTATSSSAASAAPPLVPTLFGKAVSLPPVPAPSKPLQLSPWEIEQAKKQKSTAGGARGGISSSSSSSAASLSGSFITTTTTPHLSLSQMQQKRFPNATSTNNAAKKRPRHVADGRGRRRGDDDGISAVSEDDDDQKKRRQDRNQREQNRSQQITHQIDHLRNVLAAANVPFKPDKFSTLASVVQYIKELQEQSKGLDEEHAKLLQTITDTTEIMNNRYLPAQTTGTGVPTLEDTSGDHSKASADVVGSSTSTSTSSSVAGGDPTLSLLQGVDFKFIFQRFPVASAVTSIDGRFLDCNGQFEQICGFTRQELLVASMKQEPLSPPQEHTAAHATEQQQPPPAAAATKNLSLFNILQQTDMELVYTAMSHMLQRPMFMNINNNGNSSRKENDGIVSDDMWTESVSLCRMDKAEVRLTLSLVRSPQEGCPRFFNCVLIAKDSD